MRRIAFLVNGDFDSPLGHRARALAGHLRDRYDIRIAYRSRRKIISLVRFVAFLGRVRPALSYVFDMSYSGVVAASVYRWAGGNALAIETGDAIYELVRSTGSRGALGEWLTRWFERFSLRVADTIVVRGSFHRGRLARDGIKVEVIQDGVDTRVFTPFPVDELRKEYGLKGLLTVGLVGSSIWSERLQMCYGWELVEAISLLRDAPVKGVMIGDGSGIPRLKARCREYGIEEKMLFLGPVPYDQLPRYLNLIDVCLSTQTNDVVGEVRTTGKLPLYLATGRYILASRVGEAKLVLGEEMLVEYEGVRDPQYPRKLAERVVRILENPDALKRSLDNVALAKERFEYSVLAEKMVEVIEQAL